MNEMASGAGAGVGDPLDPDIASVIVHRYEGDTLPGGRSGGSGSGGGAWNGHGTAWFKDGHVYQGQFQNGLMHGKGHFRWADGMAYEGDVRFNNITGVGKYSWPDGGVYEGEVVSGMRHGRGTYSNDKLHCYYEGTWREGCRHGTGKLYYDAQRKCFYDGQWFNGRRHGDGFMRYSTGNTYQGQWDSDRKHGQGVMHWYDSRQTYVGAWHADLPQGRGEYSWADIAGLFSTSNPNNNSSNSDDDAGNSSGAIGDQQSSFSDADSSDWSNVAALNIVTGSSGGASGTTESSSVRQPIDSTGGARFTHLQLQNKYVGEFSQGLRHGAGTFIYASGARYDGLWVDDQKHGHGVFVFENGTVYDGEFQHDRMVGLEQNGGGVAVGATVTTADAGVTTNDSNNNNNKPTPSGAGVGEKDGKFDLQIDDVMAQYTTLSPTQKDDEREQVANLFLRYNSELQAVYRYYSSVHSETVEEALRMQQSEFWSLVHDCGLTSPPHLTTVHIDRILHAPKPKQYHLFQSQLPDVHDPGTILLRRDFLDALVRIAHAKYDSVSSLADRVKQLITEDIIPRAKTGPWPLADKSVQNVALVVAGPVKPETLHLVGLCSKEIKAVYSKYEEQLVLLYTRYVKSDRLGSLHREATTEKAIDGGQLSTITNITKIDRTITFREFLQLLADRMMYDKRITVKRALQLFVQAQLRGTMSALDSGDDPEEHMEHLETELTYHEFKDSLCRCAELKFSKEPPPPPPIVDVLASGTNEVAPSLVSGGADSTSGDGLGSFSTPVTINLAPPSAAAAAAAPQSDPSAPSTTKKDNRSHSRRPSNQTALAGTDLTGSSVIAAPTSSPIQKGRSLDPNGAGGRGIASRGGGGGSGTGKLVPAASRSRLTAAQQAEQRKKDEAERAIAAEHAAAAAARERDEREARVAREERLAAEAVARALQAQIDHEKRMNSDDPTEWPTQRKLDQFVQLLLGLIPHPPREPDPVVVVAAAAPVDVKSGAAVPATSSVTTAGASVAARPGGADGVAGSATSTSTGKVGAGASAHATAAKPHAGVDGHKNDKAGTGGAASTAAKAASASGDKAAAGKTAADKTVKADTKAAAGKAAPADKQGAASTVKSGGTIAKLGGAAVPAAASKVK